MSADDDEVGDAVCWLDRLCPGCGAMPSPGTSSCWRCGAPRSGAVEGEALRAGAADRGAPRAEGGATGAPGEAPPPGPRP